MPKQRIIACLIVKGGVVVQSVGFDTYLPIGRPHIAARFLDDWGIDEIILLDIDASAEGRLIDPALVGEVSRSCFVPLTVGGGISTVDDIRIVLHAGADKIAINRMAIENPATVSEASRKFGRQCIVASIDAKRSPSGTYKVFGHGGRRDAGVGPRELARTLEAAGVGEILLNAIHCDGAGTGFDLEMIGEVIDAVEIPVVVCGGAGHPAHFREVLERYPVSGVAAANFFQFTEHSVSVLKSFLIAAGLEVRMESRSDYSGLEFEEDGRVTKRPDAALIEQVFEYVPEEVI